MNGHRTESLELEDCESRRGGGEEKKRESPKRRVSKSPQNYSASAIVRATSQITSEKSEKHDCDSPPVSGCNRQSFSSL